MQIKKIFLASSEELKTDREQFEIFINRKNKEWVARDVFLDLVIWEDFLDAMSQTRLQDEYNRAIRDCDLFVMLFSTKVGKYTEEEFETAFGQFKAANRPIIYTYFKDAPVSLRSIDEADLLSVLLFRKKLNSLGHFLSVYNNIDSLQLQFYRQLDRLAVEGFLRLASVQDLVASPAPSPSTLPHLAYGSWTLRDAIDENGIDWGNSVLKFSAQEASPEGLRLRGSFTWRNGDQVVGTEEVQGFYFAATREIVFEGISVTNPDWLAVGSYFAILSADERELNNGRWGSSALDVPAGYSANWKAQR